MKDILIVFERDDTFIAKAIRWFTKGRVNHVAVEYVSTDWQEKWVIEALPRGVFARKSKNRKWYAAFKYNPKDGNASEKLREISKYVGNKYDFSTFFMFMWIQICWNWFKIKTKKPWKSAKGQMCSELISRLVEDDVDFENPQWVHPEQLLSKLEENPVVFPRVV